jgi:hypothetical protein
MGQCRRGPARGQGLRDQGNGTKVLERSDGDQGQHQHGDGTHRDLERLGTGTVDHVEDAFRTFDDGVAASSSTASLADK